LRKNNTKFIEPFSEEIYDQTYKFGDDNDIDGTHKRVAIDLASKETDTEYWTDKFLDLLEDFKFAPGGRITSNAGTGLKKTTMINCYVSGFTGESQDSMEGILDELRRQALILKSEGGYGFCCSVLRPRSSFVSGIGNGSPGSVAMLEMWDTQSSVITQGSGVKNTEKKSKNKIRKGAQMVTMHIWHPDIEELITVKQTPGNLTKFNMSVLLTDDFMKKVKEDKEWKLEFPDMHADKIIYDKEWDGDLELWKSKNYPVKIYKTLKARELWGTIMNSTYTRNEPGILFIDTINKMNNLSYCEKIDATNPSLRKGTKVLTKDGIVPIESLQDKEFYVKNLNGEWSIAKCFLSGKDKKLTKITLRGGKEIYCTPEHKWPVASRNGGFGKVETKDLLPKNLLPITRESKLDICKNSNFTREDGFFVGWLLGDGCISTRTTGPEIGKKQMYLVFGEEELDIAEKILKWVNERKEKTSTINKHPNNNSYQIQISDQSFINMVIDVFQFKNKEDGIPGSVWTSNDDYIKGFVDGIYSSDGYFEKERIQLTSSRKKIVQDVSDLLSFYGIKTCITSSTNICNYPNAESSECTRHDMYANGANAVHFSEILTLTHERKNKTLKEINKNKGKRVALQDLIEIVSIEETEIYEDVWDISVYDDTHCFRIEGAITGNCGEQVLPHNGSCLLGSINLTQFINNKNDDWDYEKLGKYIPTIVRLMDNVIDNTNYPLDIQKKEMDSKRRIGCGYVGYGSALLMMKIRYGSKRALHITDQLSDFVTNHLYMASASLAKEKGAFPLFDKEKYLAGNFVKNLSKSTRDLIAMHGLRNSHLTSIQPTGNTSIFINNVSGGLEPLFMFDYIRTSMQPYAPEGLDVPKAIDWSDKTYKSNNEWKWVKEGDQALLAISFEGVTWKFDKDRGLLKETRVADYGVRMLEKNNDWDATADYAANVFNLGLSDHIDTMAVFAKYIDSAMSKTINLPKDFSFEDFKKLYEDIHATGVIKGATTYREGTMTSVLSKDSSLDAAIDGIRKTNAKKRPKSLDCSVGLAAIKGEKWITIISTLDKDPYEIFAFKNNNMIKKSMNGKLIRVKSRIYNLHLDDGTVIEDIHSRLETDEQEAVTRMTSMALRHGADVEFVVTQLIKSEGNITSFSKAVGRALKKYVKEIKTAKCEDCGSKDIVMSEGCFKCISCGSSKCG